MALSSIVFWGYLFIVATTDGIVSVLKEFCIGNLYANQYKKKQIKNAIRSVEFLSIITYFPIYRLHIFKQLHVINRNSVTFFNRRQSIRSMENFLFLFAFTQEGCEY